MKNTNKDILKNLKETGFKAPVDYFDTFEDNFHQIKKDNSTGFKVPKNYFENFENSFNTKDILNPIKGTGFKTPENYFDNIEDQISPNLKKGKIISLKRSNFVRIIGLAVAASILLFFGISNYETSNNSLNTIAATEIDAWMDEGLVSFNTYEIEDMFTENDLNLIAEETDEISDYLNYTDIETLILEN